MSNSFSGDYHSRLQDTNIVQLRGHVFFGNTFRSRKLREEVPFALAGRIKNRDEINMIPLLADK